jgi:hypothetical protein
MATLEVRSVPNLLGTPVSYAYAIKAPWIFLTGHEALISRGVSRRSCRPVGLSPVRAAPQPARGRFYLATHAAHPKEFGSDLGNGVRLDQYYPTPAAVDPYHLARHAEFGDYIPPTTSVVMERCFAADNNISTSSIAAMPGHEIHRSIRRASAPHPARASCRPWSATTSSSSLGKWRTMRGRGSTRGCMFPTIRPGPAAGSASRPNLSSWRNWSRRWRQPARRWSGR